MNVHAACLYCSSNIFCLVFPCIFSSIPLRDTAKMFYARNKKWDTSEENADLDVAWIQICMDRPAITPE